MLPNALYVVSVVQSAAAAPIVSLLTVHIET